MSQPIAAEDVRSKQYKNSSEYYQYNYGEDF